MVLCLQYQTEKDGVMVEKKLLINTEGSEDPAQVIIIIFIARCYAEHSTAMAGRLSVHLSVMLNIVITYVRILGK